jgi:hypothetical protein
MATGSPSALWATIFEIEPGLFQAIYSNTGSEVDEGELPSYQTGAGIADAKRRFEHSARVLGYRTVTWVEVIPQLSFFREEPACPWRQLQTWRAILRRVS